MKIRIAEARPKDFDLAHLPLLATAGEVAIMLDGHVVAHGEISAASFVDGGVEFTIRPPMVQGPINFKGEVR